MKNLSEKAQRVLEYLWSREGEGIPPTVREICADLNIKSTSSVHKYLGELEQSGYIVRKGEKLNRAIKLAGQGSSFRVPLLGTVTAGNPILAAQQIEGYVSYSGRGSAEEFFALNIRGESMINAGIFDGDIVIIRRCPTAENGDIVVAMIDDEATVKRFYKENGGYRLQPENDTMQPIITDHVVILGKVASLIRNFE